MATYVDALEELAAGRSALSVETATSDLTRSGWSPFEGISPASLRAGADNYEAVRDVAVGASVPPGPQRIVTGTIAVIANETAKLLRRQAEEEEKRLKAAYEEAERQRLAAERRQKESREYRDYRDRVNGGRDFGETSRNDWDRHSSRDRPIV